MYVLLDTLQFTDFIDLFHKFVSVVFYNIANRQLEKSNESK